MHRAYFFVEHDKRSLLKIYYGDTGRLSVNNSSSSDANDLTQPHERLDFQYYKSE